MNRSHRIVERRRRSEPPGRRDRGAISAKLGVSGARIDPTVSATPGHSLVTVRQTLHF
jgi:hypothetical protein